QETSRSFWRYWVSAIGKFIPKSGAECRVHTSDSAAHVSAKCQRLDEMAKSMRTQINHFKWRSHAA
ncbi:hypothetical protein ACK4AA_09895, partial [Aeromonas veronii]